MKFVFFVEGTTEYRVIGPFLRKWLDAKTSKNVGIKPVKFEGWPEMVRDMPKKARMYLDGPAQDDVIAVVALLDLYGPTIYPASLQDAEARLQWATKNLEEKVADPRFRAFFAVHEVEAWLLSCPDIFPKDIADAVEKRAVAPEQVDFDCHPSKLLDELYRTGINRKYKKVTDGIQLFSKLDPAAAAERCPELRKMFEALLRMAQQAGQ